MEEEKKKKGKYVTVKGKALTIYIIIIVVIASVISFGSGFVFGKKLYEKEQNEQQKEVNEKKTNIENDETQNMVTDQLLNELINISELNSTNPISVLFDINGNLNDIDKEMKSKVIFSYALRNNLLTRVTGEEYSYCADGSGFCSGIKKSDFSEIIKKYGFDTFVPEIYGHDCYVYNDMYLFNYGGDVTEYSEVSHNYNYEVENDDIVITDIATFIGNGSVSNKNETRDYIFRKSSDDFYYLYSINLNNG